MTSCRTETETVSQLEKAGPIDCYCSHQSMASWSLCSCQGSWCTFKCVKLMLQIFEFGILLFDYFVYRQKATCLKRFTRYRYYTCKMEDIIIGRLAVVS